MTGKKAFWELERGLQIKLFAVSASKHTMHRISFLETYDILPAVSVLMVHDIIETTHYIYIYNMHMYDMIISEHHISNQYKISVTMIINIMI